MDRRTFIATITACSTGLAGCAAITGDNETPSEQPASPNRTSNSPTGTSSGETPTGAGETPDWAGPLYADDSPRFSLIELETIPRTFSLLRKRYRTAKGADVRIVFTATGTGDHPPRLAASFTNQNQYEQTFEFEWTPPFGRLVSANPQDPITGYGLADATYRDTLGFVPTSRHQLVDDPAEVTLADDGTWRHDGAPARGFPDQATLQPEETIYGEYFLAGHPEGAGNGHPEAVYEFSRGQEGNVPIVVWDSSHPGPESLSEFQGTTVPGIGEDQTIAWFHEANQQTKSFVHPSVERTDLPAKIDFTFINHATSSTECGHWNLYKLHDGEWFHLGPYIHTADCRILLPGGTKTWTMYAFHSEGFESREATAFGHLGGGRYAAVAGYGHKTDKSAALVELVADAIEIVPTDDVSTDQSDGRVTVTSALWDDGEAPESAKLTVTRTDSAERTLITEQVMSTRGGIGRHARFRGLRNTIPFLQEGIERVVLRTDEDVAESVVGYDAAVTEILIAPLNQSYRVEIEREAE